MNFRFPPSHFIICPVIDVVSSHKVFTVNDGTVSGFRGKGPNVYTEVDGAEGPDLIVAKGFFKVRIKPMRSSDDDSDSKKIMKIIEVNFFHFFQPGDE
jgi:hypothetical protein